MGINVTGVKRHAVVDTIGLVWGLSVTPANVPDGKGARVAVAEAHLTWLGEWIAAIDQEAAGVVRR